MAKFKPKATKGPEAKIQADLISLLRNKEWYVRATHGSVYQTGFPDLFATHKMYGHRWIDVKNPLNYKFTEAQLDVWPKLCAYGSGVWILIAATETEYAKLLQPPNWYVYTMAWKQHRPLG